MDKIRLGNDIEMRWSIFTRDGDNKVPYNLEGRALTLSVVNRTGESEIEFFTEGNIVTGVFRGRDQRILGKHGVILRENNGKDGMRTIDACDAFELVACSCEEALGSSGTIQLFHLTFDSTIGAITGTIDPILNYEAEQAEAERKANEVIRKANEGQRIDNEKQRNVNEILRNTAEEERENVEQERIVNEDLRKADEAERKTNEENRLQNESERVSSEEERLYAESIRVANENARIASEAKRKEAETARVEAEDKRIVSEKSRLSAESSRIANEDSRRANEDSRLSAEAKRVSAETKRVGAEEERQIAEEERQAKFASMVVQSTGDATDKVMSQKAVTEALKGKQEKLVAGDNITIEGNVISSTGGGSIDLSAYAKQADVDAALAGKANLQHHHTVADITDFPELYYDATAFFTSAYPSDKYGELLQAVKAKKTVYATLNEEGDISYVFFTSLANSDASSSRVLLTTIFVDGSYLYLNTFVLQQSGMTRLQENITSKANKATTLAGYGIADAYTKRELDALLNGKQDTLTDTDGSYGQRVAKLEKEGIASQAKLTELEGIVKEINIPFFNRKAYIDLSSAVVGEIYTDNLGLGLYNYAKIECHEGEIFLINTTGNTDKAKAYAILDHDNRVLAVAKTAVNAEIVIPTGGVSLYVNSKVDALSYIKKKDNAVEDNKEGISELRTDVGISFGCEYGIINYLDGNINNSSNHCRTNQKIYINANSILKIMFPIEVNKAYIIKYKGDSYVGYTEMGKIDATEYNYHITYDGSYDSFELRFDVKLTAEQLSSVKIIFSQGAFINEIGKAIKDIATIKNDIDGLKQSDLYDKEYFVDRVNQYVDLDYNVGDYADLTKHQKAPGYGYVVVELYQGESVTANVSGGTVRAKSMSVIGRSGLVLFNNTFTYNDTYTAIEDCIVIFNVRIADGYSIVAHKDKSKMYNQDIYTDVVFNTMLVKRLNLSGYRNIGEFGKIIIDELYSHYLALVPNHNLPHTKDYGFITTDADFVQEFEDSNDELKMMRAKSPCYYYDGKRKGCIVLFDEAGEAYIIDNTGNKKYISFK